MNGPSGHRGKGSRYNVYSGMEISPMKKSATISWVCVHPVVHISGGRKKEEERERKREETDGLPLAHLECIKK